MPPKKKRAASPASPAPATKKTQRKKGKAELAAEQFDKSTAGSSNKLDPSTAPMQLAVPVDEVCPLSNYRVWIDEDGLIWDANLNQTNAGNNNNKFYRIQLLRSAKGEYRTWTRWGRVGERGQNATLGNGSLTDAVKHFEKKFKDKSGLTWENRLDDPKPSKYVFIERSYLPDSDDEDKEPQAEGGAAPERQSRSMSPPKCTLEPQVKSLMELIFNEKFWDAAMMDINYDPKKLPLGKLSKATIARGFQALKNLSEVLNDPARAGEREQYSNLYYSLIPHNFGRNRPPIISSVELLKKEIDLCENLSDLKAADDILKAADKVQGEQLHPLDSRYRSLGMQEMTPLSPETQEFAEIQQYLIKTCGETHDVSYDVQSIFRIERSGEFERFQQSEFSKISSDRRLLWHGSRATNFGGILSQGLRIAPPEAPVSGYMFGKGIYLASMSSKSANYCVPYISNGEALLLLCEAELGNPMQILEDAEYAAGEHAKEKGLFSTWGQGMIGPKGWKDAGCVHPELTGVQVPDTKDPPGRKDNSNDYGLYYDEFICYDVAQVRLRYLLRVKMDN